VHPVLVKRDVSCLALQKDGLNNEMLARAADRLSLYEKLKIHEPCENRIIHCPEINPGKENGKELEKIPESLLVSTFQTISKKLEKTGRKIVIISFVSLLTAISLPYPHLCLPPSPLSVPAFRYFFHCNKGKGYIYSTVV
jgi:hypothetical protein